MQVGAGHYAATFIRSFRADSELKRGVRFSKGRWTLLLTGPERDEASQSCLTAFSSKANLQCVSEFLVILVFFKI